MFRRIQTLLFFPILEQHVPKSFIIVFCSIVLPQLENQALSVVVTHPIIAPLLQLRVCYCPHIYEVEERYRASRYTVVLCLYQKGTLRVFVFNNFTYS